MARRRMGRFGGRRARKPTSWVTAIANGVAQDVGGTLFENNLLDGSDWGTQLGVSKQGHLIRTIGRFGVTWLSDATAGAGERVALFWALYIIDAEDSDSSIVSSTNGIMDTCRVLACGCETAVFNEVATADVGTEQRPGLRIEWDARLRARLGPDDVLALGTQLGATIQGTSNSITLSGYSRCLIKEP